MQRLSLETAKLTSVMEGKLYTVIMPDEPEFECELRVFSVVGTEIRGHMETENWVDKDEMSFLVKIELGTPVIYYNYPGNIGLFEVFPAKRVIFERSF